MSTRFSLYHDNRVHVFQDLAQYPPQLGIELHLWIDENRSAEFLLEINTVEEVAKLRDALNQFLASNSHKEAP